MLDLLKNALGSASRYAVSHPITLLSMARHAAGLRWAIPLDVPRWLVKQLPPSEMTPRDVTIEARPPAILIGATLDVMGTKVRAALSVSFDEIRISPDELRLFITVTDIAVNVIEPKNSPLSQLLASGAIDLSKPASLLGFVPSKPKFLVGAKDSTFELDLMEIPGVADNPTLLKALGTVTPVFNLRAIRTDGDLLIVAFQATPFGLPEALANLRA